MILRDNRTQYQSRKYIFNCGGSATVDKYYRLQNGALPGDAAI